jgi:hypothetical protein
MAAKSATPAGLKARGRALFRALSEARDLAGGNHALAVEAARIADRLDKLESVLSGDADTWCRIRVPRGDDAETVTVVVDGALSEARQQANVLRQIVAGLPMKGGDDDSDADAFIDGLSA